MDTLVIQRRVQVSVGPVHARARSSGCPSAGSNTGPGLTAGLVGSAAALSGDMVLGQPVAGDIAPAPIPEQIHFYFIFSVGESRPKKHTDNLFRQPDMALYVLEHL